MSTEKLVCFAHGKESGPWGTKITCLAKVARDHGYDVLSPDYSGTTDPAARVRQLLELSPKAGQLVLVGSSMGGYVSAMACETLKPQALYLMAPALYFPGWNDEPTGIPEICTVIHGLNDEIVPVERARRFAERNNSELHLLEADHGLNQELETLSFLLARLLRRLAVV